jgi:hypothetical protein
MSPVVTGISGSSPDMDRHFRFKSGYGPAIQVQTLNGLMEINSLSVKELTWQHSRKCEGRNGAEKLEPGQNIYYMHCW